jgi:hypothetical protein
MGKIKIGVVKYQRGQRHRVKRRREDDLLTAATGAQLPRGVVVPNLPPAPREEKQKQKQKKKKKKKKASRDAPSPQHGPVTTTPAPARKQPFTPNIDIQNVPPPPPTPTAVLDVREACARVPANFHGPTVRKLTQFLASQAQQGSPSVVLLSGPYGSGKTFCLRRACEAAGYTQEVVSDATHEDPFDQFKQAALLAQGGTMMRASTATRPRTVVVVDAVEEHEPSFLRQLGSFLRSLWAAAPKKGKQRRTAFRTQPIVLTTSSEFDKAVYALTRGFKPHQGTTIRCEPVCARDALKLATAVCSAVGGSQRHLQAVCTAHAPDMNAVLANLELSCLGPPVRPSAQRETRAMNLLTCCKQLLQPPTAGRVSAEDYTHLWERGGERVDQVVFNSYPLYTPFSMLVTPRNAKAVLGRGVSAESVRKGGEVLAELAEVLSLCDAAAWSAASPEFAFTHRISMKHAMEGVSVRASPSRRLELTRPPQPAAGIARAMARCRVDRRRLQDLWHVSLMHVLETQRRLADYSYTPPEDYELCRFVATYQTRFRRDTWVTLDMCDEEQGRDEDKGTAARSKTKQRAFALAHPASQVAKVVGHRFR